MIIMYIIMLGNIFSILGSKSENRDPFYNNRLDPGPGFFFLHGAGIAG
jgi:hypothetical protein